MNRDFQRLILLDFTLHISSICSEIFYCFLKRHIIEAKHLFSYIFSCPFLMNNLITLTTVINQTDVLFLTYLCTYPSFACYLHAPQYYSNYPCQWSAMVKSLKISGMQHRHKFIHLIASCNLLKVFDQKLFFSLPLSVLLPNLRIVIEKPPISTFTY